MNCKNNELIQQLEKLENKNIEYGWCKSRLFGESEMAYDKDEVKNKDMEIFYVIRKANKSNAPYLIFFNGGPGVGFTEAFTEMLECETFFPQLNVVCMDQRGTGCSSKPSDNLMELKYYTARYISYDAEQIRKKLIGDNEKWIVFGESYGGHVVRKYLELYPEKAFTFISFGYAECSPVTMKVNIHLQLNKLMNSYFERFPNDLKTIEGLKAKLKDTDYIATEKAKISGECLVDALAYVFGLVQENQIHEMLSKLDGENMIETFIKEIDHLTRLLLNAGTGKLNPVVAYIDLLEGMTDEVLGAKVEASLNEIGFDTSKEILSKRRFVEGIERISEDPEAELLEKLFVDGHFEADPIDLQKLIMNIDKHKLSLHVFGSTSDTLTPVEAVQEEERTVKQMCRENRYCFYYTNGNHREWLYDNNMFSYILGEV